MGSKEDRLTWTALSCFASTSPQMVIKKCPECRDEEDDKANKLREAIHAKTEAKQALEEVKRQVEEEQRQQAAKTLEYEREELEVYKSQAANFQKLIDGAGANIALAANMTKMLNKCKILWADKVKKMETSNPQPTPAGKLNSASLNDKMAKIELFAARAKILLEKERINPNPERQQKLENQLKEWTTITKTMKTAVETYETYFAPHIETVKQRSIEAWEGALRLMKED